MEATRPFMEATRPFKEATLPFMEATLPFMVPGCAGPDIWVAAAGQQLRQPCAAPVRVRPCGGRRLRARVSPTLPACCSDARNRPNEPPEIDPSVSREKKSNASPEIDPRPLPRENAPN
eukprot:2194999-Rhodomonas_salina.1